MECDPPMTKKEWRNMYAEKVNDRWIYNGKLAEKRIAERNRKDKLRDAMEKLLERADAMSDEEVEDLIYEINIM